MSNRYDDDASDIISTSAPNSGLDENSPPYGYGDDDGVSNKSKKIRKKRNAYQKIDDDVRVKLLEAVQQHGETLKAAAKRYGINYSSAKSILHTYRKEGRILKKSAQDRGVKRRPDAMTSQNILHTPPTDLVHTQSMPSISNHRMDFRQNLRVNTGRPEMRPESERSFGDLPSPSSPMNKLTDHFGNILQINQNGMYDENNNGQQYQPHRIKQNVQPGNIQNMSRFNPKYEPRNMQMEGSPNIHSSTSQMQQPQMSNFDGTFDMLNNFYMNYSNSPLSSERIVKDGSSKSTGTNRLAKEFDSFSDMINALQKKTSEELKDEIHIPRPLRYNTAQKFQEQLESKMGNEEEWKGTIENAALDTFRTVVDAQLLLCDALKKASFLNNLVQIQKGKEPGQKNPE